MTTYWNPDIETLSPEALQTQQATALQQTLRACLRVPHYREHLAQAGIDEATVTSGQVRTVEDLAAIPFFDKDQLRKLQPWGVHAKPMTEVVRINATTGTTGLPCNIGFTRNDLDNIGELGARNLTAVGVGIDDIAWQCYGYGLWIAGSSFDRAYERIGVTAFPAGPGRTSLAIERLGDLGVTVISCTPTFALLLVERALEAGIDPAKDWKLRVGIFGGETISPAARARLQEAMPAGFVAHNTYGTTELGGPFVAGTCEYSAEQGSFHVWADHHLVEIIDTDTGVAITEPGVPGELVVTSLQREASPMLRWRTRDLTAWAPDTDACPCGRRAHPKIAWISGRSDDMIKVRGTQMMPSQVEDVLCSTPGTGLGWQIVIDKDPGGLRATEAAVVVEVAEHLHATVIPDLTARLRDRLGIRLPVIAVAEHELARYEGKAARVVSLEKFIEAGPNIAKRLTEAGFAKSPSRA